VHLSFTLSYLTLTPENQVAETHAEKIIRLTREKEASDLRLARLTSQIAGIDLLINQIDEEIKVQNDSTTSGNE